MKLWNESSVLWRKATGHEASRSGRSRRRSDRSREVLQSRFLGNPVTAFGEVVDKPAVSRRSKQRRRLVPLLGINQLHKGLRRASRPCDPSDEHSFLSLVEWHAVGSPAFQNHLPAPPRRSPTPALAAPGSMVLLRPTKHYRYTLSSAAAVW